LKAHVYASLNSFEYPLSGVDVSSTVKVVLSVTSQPKLISSVLEVVFVHVLVDHVLLVVVVVFEDELDDEDHPDEPLPEDEPHHDEVGLAVNVADTVTLAAGIMNLLLVTVIVVLSASLTFQLQKL
jgi:hypothetical protein